METNLTRYKKDLDRLIHEGYLLLAGLYNELNEEYLLQYISNNDDRKVVLQHKNATFTDKYQIWYSETYTLIQQLLPSRLDDFVLYYKKPKGKSGFDISMVLIDTGSYVSFGNAGEIYLKLYQQQFLILKAVATRFESSLYDIKQLLQADVFDSEIESAKELCKKGFYRAAGAICGVVIEKHLDEICKRHQLKISKKNPGINDYNELLKANDIIDTHVWRNIQRLADIRNMCDHHKGSEPTKDCIEELITGTDKILKTIF